MLKNVGTKHTVVIGFLHCELCLAGMIIGQKQGQVVLVLNLAWSSVFVSLILVFMVESTKEENGYHHWRKGSSCAYGCLLCQGMNGCIQCKAGLFLFIQEFRRRQRGYCVYRCPSGYFGERSRKSSICKKCARKFCTQCFDDTYCRQCLFPTYRYKGKCVFHCPPGLDRDEKDRSCVQKRDCKVSRWSKWSKCTSIHKEKSCSLKKLAKEGVKLKERFVLQYPSISGAKCKRLKKMKPCRLRHCTDDNDRVLQYLQRKLQFLSGARFQKHSNSSNLPRTVPNEWNKTDI